MTKPIEVTDELLTRLYEAQKEHLIHILRTHGNGDDGGDYITSALDIFKALQEMSCDQSDTRALEVMLNTPTQEPEVNYDHITYDPYTDQHGRIRHRVVPALCAYACDGICDALYELNCPALPKED